LSFDVKLEATPLQEKLNGLDIVIVKLEVDHIVQALSFMLLEAFDAAVKDKAEESAKPLSGACPLFNLHSPHS
jgi:hypothetical protein